MFFCLWLQRLLKATRKRLCRVREAFWLMAGQRNAKGSGGWKGSHLSVSSPARDLSHTSKEAFAVF